MNRPSALGFTLIELLVVISIIAMLAGMLIPALGVMRDSSRKSRCSSNQRQILMAMLTYSIENQRWPYYGIPKTGGSSLAVLWWKTESDSRLFVCPADPSLQTTLANLNSISATTTRPAIPTWSAGQTSYAYDVNTPIKAKAGRPVVADKPSSAVSAIDVVTSHNRLAIVAFADGHVGNISKLPGSATFSNADVSPADTDIYTNVGDTVPTVHSNLVE